MNLILFLFKFYVAGVLGLGELGLDAAPLPSRLADGSSGWNANFVL